MKCIGVCFLAAVVISQTFAEEENWFSAALSRLKRGASCRTKDNTQFMTTDTCSCCGLLCASSCNNYCTDICKAPSKGGISGYCETSCHPDTCICSKGSAIPGSVPDKGR